MGSTRTSSLEAIGALGLYLAASIVLFGLPVLAGPGDRFIGPPAHPDPRFFFWAMAWWPHALVHGLNPIWTSVVWAPEGYNLAWATGAPGPSLLMAPITLTAGPVVAYNVLALLACPLSGLAAFAVCRRITGSFWPSLASGYLFGFSTYHLGHLGLHVNLELVFLIPLAVYLVLLRANRDLGPRAFVALLALVLVFQFLTSTEVFATFVLFGALALSLAIVFGPPERRSELLSVAKLIAVSLLVTAVVVSPLLWYAFAYGVPRRDLDGSDLLSFVLPRLRTLVGSRTFFDLTRTFPGTSVENTAYLGLPLLGIVVHFAITRWRELGTRFLVTLLGVLVIAALGPRLFVAGHRSIPMPWRAVQTLPVINNASPRRFTLYIFLICSVVVAIWLSVAVRSRLRWAAVLVAAVFLFPNFSPEYLHGRADVPRFFADGAYRRFIRPGDSVLILPTEAPSGFPQAISMVVQARTEFPFRMALAYTGPPPPEFEQSRILRALYEGRVPDVGLAEFDRFLTAHQIRAIILDRGSMLEQDLTALIGLTPTPAGDVLVYEVQPP
jgi:hypothetical protein